MDYRMDFGVDFSMEFGRGLKNGLQQGGGLFHPVYLPTKRKRERPAYSAAEPPTTRDDPLPSLGVGAPLLSRENLCGRQGKTNHLA